MEVAMRRIFVVPALLLSTALLLGATMKSTGAKPEWSMNATAIEACSCPAFCQCYFNTEPSGHGEHAIHEGHASEHFCQFNNAYKVNKGYFGATKLDGAKFWIYGDLGGDFTKGMDWAVVTFDKSTTPAQREAIGKIAGRLFPVHWNSLTTAEGEIVWNGGVEQASASLDGGQTAELTIKKFKGMKDQAVVIKNLPYWGAPRNDGFIVMPNVSHTLHKGDKNFDYKGTNGFMITFDIDANSAPPAATGM
jgi:hypothetical protein